MNCSTKRQEAVGLTGVWFESVFQNEVFDGWITSGIKSHRYPLLMIVGPICDDTPLSMEKGDDNNGEEYRCMEAIQEGVGGVRR